MPHPYSALVWGMGISLALFFSAYALRKSNRNLHKLFAMGGVVFNLVSSVYLIYAVRIAGIEMASQFSFAVITAHRLFATLIALLMLVMVYTGIKRQRRLHIALHRFFLAGYTLTYISGLVIFHG